MRSWYPASQWSVYWMNLALAAATFAAAWIPWGHPVVYRYVTDSSTSEFHVNGRVIQSPYDPMMWSVVALMLFLSSILISIIPKRSGFWIGFVSALFWAFSGVIDPAPWPILEPATTFLVIANLARAIIIWWLYRHVQSAPEPQ